MATPTLQNGLARRRLGVIHLIFFTVSASAPMTVLIGGIVTAFLVTGNTGVPLVFPILAIALALFSVGYAAMSRYVSNAGAFYSYLSQGLGRAWGVAGSFVAIVAYNGMQIGLYGLLGATLGPFVDDTLGVNWPWWAWSLAALALIGILGILRVDLNARIIAVLLLAEIAAVTIYDIIALANPAGGSWSFGALRPDSLFASGVGGAFAFGIACFVGFESGAIYSEEARDPRRTVARATYAALAFTGVFYAITAWAITVNLGPDQVVPAVQERSAGVVFDLLASAGGAPLADIATCLLVTSIFAALLSFHNGVARYLFALGRERVLPAALGRTGVGSGAPIAGSVIQSLVALGAVATFAALGRDPVTELFSWLTYAGATGVLLLMTGTSCAVIGFFRRRPTGETRWQRAVAPGLGAAALASVTTVTIIYAGDVLGPTAADHPSLRWILPGIVLLAAVAGAGWSQYLRTHRPEVYAGVGRGAVEPVGAATTPAPSPVPI